MNKRSGKLIISLAVPLIFVVHTPVSLTLAFVRAGRPILSLVRSTNPTPGIMILLFVLGLLHDIVSLSVWYPLSYKIVIVTCLSLG